MNVYIAIKYDPSNLGIITDLKEVVAAVGGTPYAFVDEGYIENEKEMMERAFAKLDQSDVLLIEASVESIGIGIEAGYAFQKKKPIITVFKKGVRLSRMLRGISRQCLEYADFADLKTKLKQALLEL